MQLPEVLRTEPSQSIVLLRSHVADLPLPLRDKKCGRVNFGVTQCYRHWLVALDRKSQLLVTFARELPFTTVSELYMPANYIPTIRIPSSRWGTVSQEHAIIANYDSKDNTVFHALALAQRAKM